MVQAKTATKSKAVNLLLVAVLRSIESITSCMRWAKHYLSISLFVLFITHLGG